MSPPRPFSCWHLWGSGIFEYLITRTTKHRVHVAMTDMRKRLEPGRPIKMMAYQVGDGPPLPPPPQLPQCADSVPLQTDQLDDTLPRTNGAPEDDSCDHLRRVLSSQTFPPKLRRNIMRLVFTPESPEYRPIVATTRFPHLLHVSRGTRRYFAQRFYQTTLVGKLLDLQRFISTMAAGHRAAILKIYSYIHDGDPGPALTFCRGPCKQLWRGVEEKPWKEGEEARRKAGEALRKFFVEGGVPVVQVFTHQRQLEQSRRMTMRAAVQQAGDFSAPKPIVSSNTQGRDVEADGPQGQGEQQRKPGGTRRLRDYHAVVAEAREAQLEIDHRQVLAGQRRTQLVPHEVLEEMFVNPMDVYKVW